MWLFCSQSAFHNQHGKTVEKKNRSERVDRARRAFKKEWTIGGRNELLSIAECCLAALEPWAKYLVDWLIVGTYTTSFIGIMIAHSLPHRVLDALECWMLWLKVSTPWQHRHQTIVGWRMLKTYISQMFRTDIEMRNIKHIQQRFDSDTAIQNGFSLKMSPRTMQKAVRETHAMCIRCCCMLHASLVRENRSSTSRSRWSQIFGPTSKAAIAESKDTSVTALCQGD